MKGSSARHATWKHAFCLGISHSTSRTQSGTDREQRVQHNQQHRILSDTTVNADSTLINPDPTLAAFSATSGAEIQDRRTF